MQGATLNIFLGLSIVLATCATGYGRVAKANKECPSHSQPVPTCPFPDPEFSVFFPHPTDCHWFYHCSNGVAYCKECAADLHWNVDLDTCDYPYRAGCSINGNSTAPPATTTKAPATSTPVAASTTTKSPPPTAAPTSATTQESGNGCPAGQVPECPIPDPDFSVFFPHSDDCHWFYHCSNGVAYCKECPTGLHWNVALDTCDYPYRAGCSVNGNSTSPPVPTKNPTTASPATTRNPTTASPETTRNPTTASPATTKQPTTNPPATSTVAANSTTTKSPPPTAAPTSATTQGSSNGCPAGQVPECPLPDPDFSVFFPHSDDCHWFYHCSNGVAYCKECPTGLHWNVALDTCDYPYRAGCSVNGNSTSPPAPTKNPTTASPATTRNPTTASPATTRNPTTASPATTKRPTTASPATTKNPTTQQPASSTTKSPPPTAAPTSATTQESSNGCPAGQVPECPLPDPDFSVFFPHSDDCHWFYHCSNGVAYCKECPTGLHWNVALDTCDYPYRAGCSGSNSSVPPSTTRKPQPSTTKPQPSTTKPTTTRAPTTTASTTKQPTTELPTSVSTDSGSTDQCPEGPLPECPFPDPEYSVFFPHSNDCRWFYHCSNGVAYCKICPDDLHWNVKLDTCDYPYRAGCSAP